MSQETQTVASADGTVIAFRCHGSGPSVVLVGGGLDDGSENAVLVPALSQEFTFFNYTRRGRGASSDTQPYAVEREIEDVAAMLGAAGGSAHVFGASSGGALALEAAAAGLPVNRLAVYDVPYSVESAAIKRWRAYRASLDEALSRGQADAALAAFMQLGGATDDDIVNARRAPYWDALVSLAPTLAYDAAVLGSGGVSTDLLSAFDMETLVLTRTASDPYMPALPFEFFDSAAAAMVAALHRPLRQVVEAPGHAVDAGAIAPPLRAFFSAPTT